MRMKNLMFIYIVLVGLFSSCSKDAPTLVNYHYEYFPLDPGTYVIYEAMDISHDIQALVARDTTRYFLKTVIGDSIIDNSGNVAYKFLRYKKQNLNDDWILTDVWNTKLLDLRIELVEENERSVKLLFPTNNDKVWNVNAFNTKQRLLARFNPGLLHQTRIFNGNILDSTVQVEIQDFFSLVDHRRKYEVYAKGVGLVELSYKDNDIMNFDTLNIRYGKESHYKMIEFGKE